MSYAKLTGLRELGEIGDLSGAIYDFKKAGDLLMKHNHTEETAHITIVARGSFRVYSHDWEMVLTTGQVANFPANQPHEFAALEDNSRLVNVTKKMGGFVDDYTPVEQEEPVAEPIEMEVLNLTTASVQL